MITTAVMISTVVGYLAKNFKESKALKDFFADFGDATIQWIRPVFLIDDKEDKEIIRDLKKNPEEELNAQAIEIAIAKAIKEEPDNAKHLEEMYNSLMQKADKGESISIVNSKNVNTGSINSMGNVIIGDNNNKD